MGCSGRQITSGQTWDVPLLPHPTYHPRSQVQVVLGHSRTNLGCPTPTTLYRPRSQVQVVLGHPGTNPGCPIPCTSFQRPSCPRTPKDEPGTGVCVCVCLSLSVRRIPDIRDPPDAQTHPLTQDILGGSRTLGILRTLRLRPLLRTSREDPGHSGSSGRSDSPPYSGHPGRIPDTRDPPDAKAQTLTQDIPGGSQTLGILLTLRLTPLLRM